MDKLKELFAQYVSEEVLTEDNLNKIEVMFESAINEGIKIKTEELDTVYDEKLKVEMEDFQNTTNDKLNSYLDVFVEEFTAENKIALTNKLVVEKAQTILTAMQQIFVENGINIPESNESLMVEMTSKFEEMESKYNKLMLEKIEIAEQSKEVEKALIFNAMTNELFDTQKEQVQNLMEGLSVDNVDEFKSKLSIVIEKVNKDDEEEDDDKDKKDKKKFPKKKDDDEVKDDDVKKESNDSWSKSYKNMKLN